MHGRVRWIRTGGECSATAPNLLQPVIRLILVRLIAVGLMVLSSTPLLLAQTAAPRTQAAPPATAGQAPVTAQSASTSRNVAAARTDAPAAAVDEATARAQNLQKLVAMLQSIDPYRPTVPLSGTVRVYGSTAMDNMAHSWADEFKLFHPKIKVEISAAGSGDAFGQLKQSPSSMVMLSRPLKPNELEQIKSDVIKEPVAFVVAREALGVFVHSSNPAKTISGEQLRSIFTKATPDSELKWKLMGLTGPMADQPIHLMARAENSGTQSFLRDFVFGGMEMRPTPQPLGSNSDVLGALANDPLGITICGLRANGISVRPLALVAGGSPVPSDDTTVLTGHYPLTRNLTLVVDMSRKDPEAKAAQELVHFALCRSGQLAAIGAGFYPADIQSLQAGRNLLQHDQLR